MNQKKPGRQLRLERLMEREIDPRDLDRVSGGGPNKQSRNDSRYCALTEDVA